jgi:hypothetical protein
MPGRAASGRRAPWHCDLDATGRPVTEVAMARVAARECTSRYLRGEAARDRRPFSPQSVEQTRQVLLLADHALLAVGTAAICAVAKCAGQSSWKSQRQPFKTWRADPTAMSADGTTHPGTAVRDRVDEPAPTRPGEPALERPHVTTEHTGPPGRASRNPRRGPGRRCPRSRVPPRDADIAIAVRHVERERHCDRH